MTVADLWTLSSSKASAEEVLIFEADSTTNIIEVGTEKDRAGSRLQRLLFRERLIPT